MENLEALLSETVKRGGSDLHFISGEPPRMRYLGDLANLSGEELSQEFVSDELGRIMSSEARQTFEERDGADFAVSFEGIARFRVNVMRHVRGMGAVFRSIPESAFRAGTLTR